MVFTWFLSMPWYYDLGLSLAVLVAGWFVIGVLTRIMVKPSKPGDEYTVTNEYGSARTLSIRDDDHATEYTNDRRVIQRLGWGIALFVVTGLAWWAPAAAVLVFGICAGVVGLAVGLTKLGDKTGGISDTIKASRARKAELLRQAEESNDAWLKKRLDEVEQEWERVKHGSLGT